MTGVTGVARRRLRYPVVFVRRLGGRRGRRV